MSGDSFSMGPREGLVNGAFGLPRTFKALPEDTDGALAVWEETVPEGAGPPLHVHRGQHELFSVLEGLLRFRCGERTIRLSRSLRRESGRSEGSARPRGGRG